MMQLALSETASKSCRSARALLWLLLVPVSASKAVFGNTTRSGKWTVAVLRQALTNHPIAALMRSAVGLAPQS